MELNLQSRFSRDTPFILPSSILQYVAIFYNYQNFCKSEQFQFISCNFLSHFQQFCHWNTSWQKLWPPGYIPVEFYQKGVPMGYFGHQDSPVKDFDHQDWSRWNFLKNAIPVHFLATGMSPGKSFGKKSVPVTFWPMPMRYC